MRSFYNTRNFQFAWFTSNGLTEQARGFWNLHEYFTTYVNDSSSLQNKELVKKMDNVSLEENMKVNGCGESMLVRELTLTQHEFV